MNRRKKYGAAFLSAALTLVLAGGYAYAATKHFADSTKDEAWDNWVQKWENQVSTDYEKVALTPGADETQMNFAWYSRADKEATPKIELSTNSNMSGAKVFEGEATQAIDGYRSNKATATALQENTTYYYRYYKNGEPSQISSFKTHSFNSYTMLYVGDPQIGASKGQTTSRGDKLENSSPLNTAARNDSFSWNKTLNMAMAANPDVSFVLSAGDQINKNVEGRDPGNEVEYAGFLSADWMDSLPVATTIGNHDSTNESYSYHFNNPNDTQLGKTAAGGDYFYKYGPALYVVLNTNNYNCAEHEQVLKQAVAAYPKTAWRIVMIHQDIYGSGLDHSDSDGIVLRSQLTPLMDKYDVDVVLQGHDHTYSRSYLLKSDSKTHAKYDFYDWDHVKDEAGEVLPYNNSVYQDENNCYTIANTMSGSVTNADGTLYMEANSSTGSKYYELIPTQQDYIAARNQNWNPTYSVIRINQNTFTIDTYEIAGGRLQNIDQTFTLKKTSTSRR
ncbi:metallophosphoesterase [Lacrimispora sp. JR3]|uniref:metallophosphoesterase n=1 Tax=Lacrimispora sinapis TaxID=3111456 RepID=UPI00374904BC